MNLTLPSSYDAWRTRAPEDDAPDHSGPHESPLLIEGDDVTIDATGHYDGEGALVSVQIGKLHVKPENVEKALALLGITIPGWDRPLDGDKLADLARGAAEYEAEARAEFLMSLREDR